MSAWACIHCRKCRFQNLTLDFAEVFDCQLGRTCPETACQENQYDSDRQIPNPALSTPIARGGQPGRRLGHGRRGSRARPEVCRPQAAQRSSAGLVLGGWVAQGASGACFGAISYVGYGRFPDIHGIAIGVLVLKMACAAAGFSVAALYLGRETSWSAPRRQRAWTTHWR
jgi:hypothetical protein